MSQTRSACAVADSGIELAVRSRADFPLQMLLFELRTFVVSGVNHALLSPADTGSVKSDRISRRMERIGIFAELRFPAIRRPYVRRRPRRSSFPVHDQRSQRIMPRGAVTFHNRKRVFVGEIFVFRHCARIEPLPAHRVNQQNRRFRQPRDHAFFEFFRKRAVFRLHPRAVKLRRILPAAAESRNYGFIRNGIRSARKVLKKRNRGAGVIRHEINGLRKMRGVAAADEKSAALRQIRLELNRRRSRIETGKTGHGILRFFAPEIRIRFPDAQIVDQCSLRKRKQILSVVKAAEADAREVDPLRFEITGSRMNLDIPHGFATADFHRHIGRGSGIAFTLRKVQGMNRPLRLHGNGGEILRSERKSVPDEIAKLNFKNAAWFRRGKFRSAMTQGNDFSAAVELRNDVLLFCHIRLLLFLFCIHYRTEMRF